MKKLISLLLCLLLLSGCAETYDGPTVSKSVCTVMEMETYNPDGSISQNIREEYAYDIHGNRSQVLSWYDDDPYEKSILRYDDEGRLLRSDTCDAGSWLPFPRYTYIYTYDDQGRMTSTTNRYRREKSTTTVTYDDEAKTRTTTAYGGVTVEYLNEQGWVLRSEQVFTNGSTVLTEFDRRPDGKPLAYRSYEDGILISETVITYDDQGRILTQTEIKDGISTLLFSFEYGEDYEKRTDSDGALTVIQYHPDGTMDCQVRYDESDRLQSMTRYSYTEIQVSAEEVSP